MTPTRALLSASLLLNLALLGTLVFTAPEISPSPAGTPDRPTAKPEPSRVGGNGATAVPAVVADAGKNWASLGTENLPALIARMQAAGFPRSVIKAVIAQRFELRREELTLDDLDVPYWKKPPQGPPNPKLTAELTKLEHEQEAVLKQLPPDVGANDIDGEEARDGLQRFYGNLPAEKIAQVAEIQRRWGEQQQAIFAAANGGVLNDVDARKMAELQRQQREEMSHVLTPEQMLEIDLRNGPTAIRLRTTLAGFNATEAEYRAMFSAYQALDEQFPVGFGTFNSEQAKARFAAQQQMQEQIKASLSPERYADYAQATRPGSQQLNTLVERLGLPLSAAASVASVQDDTQARVARLDPQLSAEERSRQVAAIAEEAKAQIVTAIGVRGLAGYRQSGGQWLDQLQAIRGKPARKP
jgi:hypothetical protein